MRFLMFMVACSAPIAAQTTYIVDAAGGPGSQFTQIQAAVNAAADGDALRVRAGTYAPFVLAQKGLRILGDDPATVLVQGDADVEIGPLGLGRDVLIEGLTTRLGNPFVITGNPRFYIHDAAASVVLRRAAIGAIPLSLTGYNGGLEIARCAQVHLDEVTVLPNAAGLGGTNHVALMRVGQSFLSLTRVQIVGISGDASYPGDVGLLLDQSDAFITASSIRGGFGGSSRTASNGGPAIRAVNGAFCVVAARTGTTSIQGGDGSTWQNWWWSASGAGDGGAGIEILGGSGARFEGNAPLGGNPGLNIGNTAVAGPPSIVAPGGFLLVRPLTAPAIASIQGTPLPGQSITFAFEGEPNATAFVLLGLATTYLPLQPIGIGALGISGSGAALLGPFVLSAAGTLDFVQTIPAPWPLVDRALYAQELVLGVTGTYVSNVAALVVKS